MSSNPSKEFFDYWREKMNDPQFLFEERPAYDFIYLISELDKKDYEMEKNKDDPPDFFIYENKKKLALEVTTLVDYKVKESNSFIKTIENEIKEYIQNNIASLPNKKVIAYVFPGDAYKKIGEQGCITIPDFSTKISKNELRDCIENALKSNLVELLEGKVSEIKLQNPEGHTFARLSKGFILPNETGDKLDFYIYPNSVFVSVSDLNDSISERIMEIIIKKEKNYISRVDKNEEWWLLISDPEEEILDLRDKFEDLQNIKFNTEFFDRTFITTSTHPLAEICELTIV